MKTKLLTAFLFLIVTSTQVMAARPSIGGLDQKLDILINALVVCPSNAPSRFVDNGDGTLCDRQTGLMWETKDASDGTVDLNNPNDVDNKHSWTGTGSPLYPPDGRAFTGFLARLNGEVAGTAPSEQLGGYSDWRLPTSAELQTILDCSFGSPCIDPIFGPTAAANYWSSTAFASGPTFAWGVNFNFGNVNYSSKWNGTRVRAVRGGR